MTGTIVITGDKIAGAGRVSDSLPCPDHVRDLLRTLYAGKRLTVQVGTYSVS